MNLGRSAALRRTQRPWFVSPKRGSRRALHVSTTRVVVHQCRKDRMRGRGKFGRGYAALSPTQARPAALSFAPAVLPGPLRSLVLSTEILGLRLVSSIGGLVPGTRLGHPQVLLPRRSERKLVPLLVPAPSHCRSNKHEGFDRPVPAIPRPQPENRFQPG